MDIVPFGPAHVPAACDLFARRYRELARQVSAAPPRAADASPCQITIERVTASGSGVAAIENGRLVGYLVGCPITFRGWPTFLSPERANGAEAGRAAELYSAMYTDACREWLDASHRGHLVVTLAHDPEALEAWHWLGFGHCLADSVRPIDDRLTSESTWNVRQAGPQDIDAAHHLMVRLAEHLRASPILLSDCEPDDAHQLARWLAVERNAMWLASKGPDVVGIMQFGSASGGASELIDAPDTCSIAGAFVVSSHRGRGVGTALLSRGLDWARARGYRRCAVDFESMNPSGAAFWQRHFDLLSIGLFRVA